MSDEKITSEVLSPGAVLNSARLAKGFSIDEVSAKLHILTSNLRALEEDRYDDVLKGDTFVKGYLRRYADHLGLDGAELVESYNENYARPETKIAGQAIKKPSKMAKTKQVIARGNNKRSFGRLFAFILLLILLVWLGLWLAKNHLIQEWLGVEQRSEQTPALLVLPQEQPVPELVDPELEATPEIPMVDEVVSSDEVDANLQEEALVEVASEVDSQLEVMPVKDSLKFELSADSWIEVRDADGQRLFADLVRGGREAVVDGEPPFNVIIGDGRGVKLSYNSRPLNFSYARNGYAEFSVP